MSLQTLLNNTQKSSSLTNAVPVKAPVVSSGGLESLVSKATPVNLKAREYQREANIAQEQATQANKLGTIIKETAKETGKRLLEPVTSTISSYKNLPSKLSEDIQAGAQDIQEGKVIKGIAKAGFRAAGDTAEAIFSPLSNAIGFLLKSTGGQKLTDSVGQTIADKSGITDWPAFQKFAMEHPNAGEDFNRLLTLGMSALETSKIEPTRMLSEAKGFANKIISGAKKTSIPPSEIVAEIKTSGRDFDRAIESGDMPVSKIYKTREGVLQPHEVEHTISDISAKLNSYKEGLGEQFKKIVDTSNPTPTNLQNQAITLVKQIPIPTGVTGLAKLFSESKPLKEAPITEPKPAISKVALNIEKQAIKDNIVKSIEEKAGFTPIEVEAQASRIAEIKLGDVEKFKRIALAKEELPAGINGGAMIVEARRYIKENPNDVQFLLDFAKSPLISESSSKAAQNLRMLREQDPYAPDKAIKDIQKAREERATRTTGEKDVVKAREKVAKEVKVRNWEDFMKTIEC